MNKKFTDRANTVLQVARDEAMRLECDYVGTEHLLLGLLREGDGVAVAVMTNLSVDLDDLARNIEKSIVTFGSKSTIGQKIPLMPRVKKVLEIAAQESTAMGHKYVGTEHLLLALMKDQESAAANALYGTGLDYDSVRDEIVRVLRGQPAPTAESKSRDAGAQPVSGTLKLTVSTQEKVSFNPLHEEFFDLAESFHKAISLAAGESDYRHPMAIRIFPDYPTGAKECPLSAILTKHGVDILPLPKGEPWRGIKFEIVFPGERKINLNLAAEPE